MHCEQFQLNDTAVTVANEVISAGDIATRPPARDRPIANVSVLCESQADIGALLASLVADRGRFVVQEQRPLRLHLDDYRRVLQTRGNTTKHVAQMIRCIRVMLRLCRAATWEQLTSSSVELSIGKLKASRPRRKTLGPTTVNRYLDAVKSFVRWMIDDERAERSPCRRVRRRNTKIDVRRERRPLSTDEAQRLIAAANAGPKIAGICGAERAMTYLMALSTGLRSAELQSLTPENFVLEGPDPHVVVKAAFAKNGKAEPVALRQDIAAQVRTYIAARTAMKTAGIDQDERLFRRPKMNPMRSFREDLAAAGIEHCVNGRFADFHALRHSFVTELIESGASPKQVQELARHHDARLTLAVYAHASRPAQRAALERLSTLASNADTRTALEQAGDERRRDSFEEDGVTWLSVDPLQGTIGITPACADLLCDFDSMLPRPRMVRFTDGPRRFWPKEPLSRWVDRLRKQQGNRRTHATVQQLEGMAPGTRVGLEAARALGFSEAFLKAHTRFAPGDPHVQADAALGKVFDGAWRLRMWRSRHIMLERTWLVGELLASRTRRGKPKDLPAGAILTAVYARQNRVSLATLAYRIRISGIPKRTCTLIKRNGVAQQTSYLLPEDIERLPASVTPDARHVTCAEAARIAQVTSGQISHAADIGKLRTNGKRHRQRLIDRESLNLWIAWREQKAARHTTRKVAKSPVVTP